MIAELVSRLIASGTPPEVAASVVAEAFAAGCEIRRQSAEHPVDETTEKRRAYDRDRQRKIRELRRQSADNPQTPQTPLTLTSSLDVSIEKEEKKVRARKRKSAELPADWKPLDAHFEAGARRGYSREGVLEKAEDMRLWAGSNGIEKVDWDLTFHGFLRRDSPKRGPHSGPQTTGKSNGPTAPNGLAKALGKLRESIGQHGGSESGCGPPIGLLPER